jgi:hypothetical protein
MATYDFHEILAYGKKYLGTKVKGVDVFVYRCILHVTAKKSIRESISSYRRISDKGATRKVLFPFTPILFLEKGSIIGVTAGTFDPTNRGDIGDREQPDKDEQHLRYQKWQIYLFNGDLTNKDCSLPGLWELIEINTPEAKPLRLNPYTPPPGYGP